MQQICKLLITVLSLMISSYCCALTITSDVNGPVTLPSKQLHVGDMAPRITLTTGSYRKQTIGGATGKVQIISTIESFNTSVCDEQTMQLEKAAQELQNVSISVVTTNQPFIVDAFAKQHHIHNITLLSTFNDPKFGLAYGVQVLGGELKGITARAVFVINKMGKIVYKQITQNIDHMPNLEAAIKAAKLANQ